MINSVQLQGLTYMQSIPKQKTTSEVEGEDFDSVLDEKINAADNTEETSSVSYTNPDDLVCVDSPSSLESYFQEASDKYGVPVALIKAVAKAESNFPICARKAPAQVVPGINTSLLSFSLPFRDICL